MTSQLPDFVALITARVQNDERPIQLTYISLNQRAIAELRVAQEELDELEQDERIRSLTLKPEEKNPDPRLGKPTAVSRIEELKNQIEILLDQIRNSTVLAVFKAPSADRQAILSAEAKTNDLPPIEQARLLALESFDHFEYQGERLDHLNSSHLNDLLHVMSQGEVYGISTPLTQISGGVIDLPKSVQSFVKTKR